MRKKKNILQLIESQRNKFPPQHLKIANYLLSHHQIAAFLSSAQLAKEAGVSQPTIIRFSRLLGFPRYQNFLEAFQDLIRAALSTADRLDLSFGKRESVSERTPNIILAEIRSLTNFARSFPWAGFDKAVNQILRGNSVYIVATRGEVPMAQHLYYFLKKVRRNVHVITDGSTSQYDRLLSLQEKDLVIAIAFPRYPRETMDIALYCNKRGINILAITDQIDSPLVPLSNHSLIVPVTLSTIFGSHCSLWCLLNMIVTEIGLANKAASATLFQKYEQLAREQNYFYSKATQDRE
jgi:DNA-binding MurR/RpiR family transcriptional regulator